MNVDEVVQNSTEQAKKLLVSAQNLINDVKSYIIRGSDTLTSSQIEEWLLVIPVMISELLPVKEAYELSRKLYTIDGDKKESQLFIDSSDKGAKREAMIKVARSEWEQEKAIMYYIRDMAGDMVDVLHSLLMSLMKIYGSKVSQPKEG